MQLKAHGLHTFVPQCVLVIILQIGGNYLAIELTIRKKLMSDISKKLVELYRHLRM